MTKKIDDEEDLTDEQKRLRVRAQKLKGTAETPIVAAPTEPSRPKTIIPVVPSWASVHDLGVVAVVLLVLMAGGIVHHTLTRPRADARKLGALVYRVPSGWLETPGVAGAGATRLEYQAFDDPRLRLEVEERPQPAFPGPIGPVLELEFGRRPGVIAKRLERAPRYRRGREWVRSRYAYAYTPVPGDAPALAGAIELAIVDGGRLHVVTIHGPDDHLAALEAELLDAVDLGEADVAR